MQYPNRLYKNGYAVTKPLVYAKGSLVIFSKESRDFSKGIYTLEEGNIKRIAIANPKNCTIWHSYSKSTRKDRAL